LIILRSANIGYIKRPAILYDIWLSHFFFVAEGIKNLIFVEIGNFDSYVISKPLPRAYLSVPEIQ
jgi:hypothetical protein